MWRDQVVLLIFSWINIVDEVGGGFGLWRLFSKVTRCGFADLAPTGEMPSVRKATALGRFYRVHCAEIVFQQRASSVFGLLEGEP